MWRGDVRRQRGGLSWFLIADAVDAVTPDARDTWECFKFRWNQRDCGQDRGIKLSRLLRNISPLHRESSSELPSCCYGDGT